MAALDRKLRKEMQIELQDLQRQLGITFVLVTHDQEEALSMSVAMSIGEGSENDGRDMGMFISNIMRLKAYFNCHILIVHHTGKDRSKGARGHSSLRAALDTEIELKADGLVRVASVTKQRDMESGKKVAFTLEVVELGVDEDLEAVTSCVVSPADVPDSTAKRSGWMATIKLHTKRCTTR